MTIDTLANADTPEDVAPTEPTAPVDSGETPPEGEIPPENDKKDAPEDPKAPDAPEGEKPVDVKEPTDSDKKDDKADKPKDETDWRKEFAGEDDKALKALGRFNSKQDFVKAYMEQKSLISSGKYKGEELPDDATDEQIAEYRKAKGIPEKADDYYNSLPEGLTFGEGDKPAVSQFLSEMHDMNADPSMVSKALEVFVASQEEAAMERSEMDIEVRDSTQLALKEEWGPDYKANLNAMSGFINSNFPEEAQGNFLNARMGDGTPLFSDPSMVKAFAQLGRVWNPSGTSTPNGGAGQIDAIDDQIKVYEARMTSKSWFNDTKAQEHYRQLVTARDNMSK